MDALAIIALVALPFAIYSQNLNDYFMADDFDLLSSIYGQPPSYFLKLLVDNESGKVWAAMGIDGASSGRLSPSWLVDFVSTSCGVAPGNSTAGTVGRRSTESTDAGLACRRRSAAPSPAAPSSAVPATARSAEAGLGL